ncbi:MAG: hypothetical protein J5I92_12365 [Thiogranum sp.]|nr:hypothetical protein [Thiogranum sp.]
MIPLHYTLIRDNGTCPPCVVLYANKGNGAPTMQRTLHRAQGEDASAFFNRIMDVARSMLWVRDRPLWGLNYSVVIFCEYDLASRRCNQNDNHENLERFLWSVANADPSSEMRVCALSALADMYGMTHAPRQH